VLVTSFFSHLETQLHAVDRQIFQHANILTMAGSRRNAASRGNSDRKDFGRDFNFSVAVVAEVISRPSMVRGKSPWLITKIGNATSLLQM
jgi:hypothetical protein